MRAGILHDAATLGAVIESGAPLVRLLRAVVATLVVIGFGSAAHQVAGGPAPQPIPLVILGVLVGPLVWCIVRSRTSVPRMVLATALGQVSTHVLLAGMSATAGGAASEPHVHGALSTHPVGASMPMTLHLTWSMLVAHAVATVVAAVLLTAGDDAVRATVRRLLAPASASASAEGPRLVARVDPWVGSLVGRSVRPVGGRAPPLRAC